jgi:integrase/recombinase XerD
MKFNSKLRLVYAESTDHDASVIGDKLHAWETWMQAGGLAPKTIRGRIETVGLFERRMGIDPLTADWRDVTGFLAPLSPGTQQNYRSNLRSWFNWLNQTGLRADDPMLQLHRGKPIRRKPRPLTRCQLNELLAARVHPRTLPMILLGAYQGFRVMEIAKFRGEDIKGEMIGVVGKGGTYDEVPLHPLVAEVAAWMPSEGFWFPSYQNPDEAILANSASHILSMVMRRAGLGRPLTPHSLRHTFGTELLESTGNVALVQRLMRHTNIASTVMYTEIGLDQRVAAIRSLPVPRNLHLVA